MATAQQIAILSTQLRPAAKRLATTYFFLKSLQSIATADSWLTVFPNDSVLIDDGSSADGRPPVIDSDIRSLISLAPTFINFMEGTAPVANPTPLTICLKIAINPEQV